jgi:hypothetical protein
MHVGNSAPLPGSELLDDLMNGVISHRGVRYALSSLDLAVSADAGIDIINVLLPDGDADGSGAIELGDFILLKQTFGQAAFNLAGDFNGDQVVDLVDFNTLKGNFGFSLPATANVPEPASWLMALCAASWFCARRKFRRVSQMHTRAG